MEFEQKLGGPVYARFDRQEGPSPALGFCTNPSYELILTVNIQP